MTDAIYPKESEVATAYLRDAFEARDRLAVLVRNRTHKETMQRISTAEKIADPSFQRWLHFKNDREFSDIYLGMNPLKSGARSRTKDDILSIRHLYLDLDNEGPTSLTLIDQSSLVPKPNYVLATSPGKFQVIWRVEDISQEQAESLLRVMARKFKADPTATDSTRVLRMPGFFNRKYDEEVLVNVQKGSDRVNHLFDFKLKMDETDPLYQPGRRSHTRVGQLSQSEHDWAFAKRALSSGAEPEAVIRKIAQYRGREKANPLDYARRTVTKAAAQLQQEGRATRTETSEPRVVDDNLNH